MMPAPKSRASRRFKAARLPALLVVPLGVVLTAAGRLPAAGGSATGGGAGWTSDGAAPGTAADPDLGSAAPTVPTGATGITARVRSSRPPARSTVLATPQPALTERPRDLGEILGGADSTAGTTVATTADSAASSERSGSLGWFLVAVLLLATAALCAAGVAVLRRRRPSPHRGPCGGERASLGCEAGAFRTVCRDLAFASLAHPGSAPVAELLRVPGHFLVWSREPLVAVTARAADGELRTKTLGRSGCAHAAPDRLAAEARRFAAGLAPGARRRSFELLMVLPTIPAGDYDADPDQSGAVRPGTPVHDTVEVVTLHPKSTAPPGTAFEPAAAWPAESYC